MGGIISDSAATLSPEILHLREIIKESSKFPSIEKIVFVVYGPPNFPILKASKYISAKVTLPIVPNEDLSNIVQDIQSGERYRRGAIIQNLPLNLKEIESLKCKLNELNIRMCLLFFEMDGETLATVLKKFDRWVNSSMDCSYHIATNPPSSYLIDGSLLDNDTGKPLLHLPQDTPEAYKTELANYNLTSIDTILQYPTLSYRVPGGSCFRETQRGIMKILYKIYSDILIQKSSSSELLTHQDGLSS